MITRYATNCARYTMSVTLEDGRKVTLEFTGKNSVTKQRFIDVTDPLITMALEKSPLFDVYFSATHRFEDNPDQVIIGGKVIIEGEKKDENIKTFSNNNEAKKWINETHGVPYHRVPNREKLTEEYLNLGIKLEIINKQQNE